MAAPSRGRYARLLGLAVAVAALLVCVTPTHRPSREALPDRLDDATFWSLITEFSEPSGFFRSDNLVSNETQFQEVIPALQTRVAPASAYLGVGPDQNFSYIAALKPRIAFLVDIRRQNMLLHLMYKALLELAPTRAEFLSRLFSRPVPARASPGTTADALLAGFDHEIPDGALFEQNLADIRERLVRGHGFSLNAADLAGIDYVYRAFYSAGPDLRYSAGRGFGYQPFPSYQDLMLETDAQGVERSYLASEDLYQALRDLEQRNLIIPIVGDFAGPRALRSIARFLEMHRATVSVFYTSNVEQYLFHDQAWEHFYANVGALPIDSRSTFIRAFFNNFGRPYRFVPIPAAPNGGRPVPIGPRSEQLMVPISTILAAFAEGRINSYGDVIELSR